MAAKRTGGPKWDGVQRKVNSNAKIKNLPDGDQETLWILMHPTDADTPPYSLEQALVHLQEEHGIECAMSTLSEWHSWYDLQKRMERATERARQATMEFAAKNPDATTDDLEKYGQFIFTSESIEKRDPKTFNALVREKSRRMSVEIDLRKMALLEAKARAADEAAALKRKLNEGGKLMPEQEREAILDKMDEILGLKK